MLQFAFGGKVEDQQYFCPQPYNPAHGMDNSFIYTSTQDSNTAFAWWCDDASREEREKMTQLVRQWKQDDRHELLEPHWEMIELGMRSSTVVSISPLQDLLGLGANARMNTCGHASGSWIWRSTGGALRSAAWTRLAALTKASGRCSHTRNISTLG